MKQLTSRIHLVWTAAVALACLTLLSACSKDDDEDGGFAGVDVLLVFGVGEETQLAGFAGLDAGKGRDGGIKGRSPCV